MRDGSSRKGLSTYICPRVYTLTCIEATTTRILGTRVPSTIEPDGCRDMASALHKVPPIPFPDSTSIESGSRSLLDKRSLLCPTTLLLSQLPLLVQSRITAAEELSTSRKHLGYTACLCSSQIFGTSWPTDGLATCLACSSGHRNHLVLGHRVRQTLREVSAIQSVCIQRW